MISKVDQTRRWFVRSLLGTSAMSLTGCALFAGDTTALPPRGTPGTVDIHAHFFNARDIPAVGFFEHILDRDADAPLNDPDLLTALVALAVEIVRVGVSTPTEELNRLTPRILARETTEMVDQQRVADGIDRFIAKTRETEVSGAEAAIVVGDETQPTQDQADQLLYEIAFEAGAAPEPEALIIGDDDARVAPLAAPAPFRGETLAAAIFAPTEPSGDEFAADAAIILNDTPAVRSESVGVNANNLVQTLRWIGLLTRDREDILDEYLRLYGVNEADAQAAVANGEDPSGVTIVSPSIVDFSAWLQNPFAGAAGDASPIPDQVAVMSGIARRRKSILMLNFVGFCPLRMAMKHQYAPAADRPRLYLEELQSALGQGFVGVKLYPPMGFLPWGNVGMPQPIGPDGTTQSFPWPEAEDGWTLIDEALLALYGFCETNNVPIKAHANNSLGAQPCSSLNANPANWQDILQRFPNLRLNLAHFGGFEESLDPPDVCHSHGDWEVTLAKMLTPENNLYIDLGFWDEVETVEGRAAVQAKLTPLIRKYPLLRERLMYGSDWTMLAQVPNNNGYLNYVGVTLRSMRWADTDAENAATVRAIERGNALTYLGLRDDTPRRRALASFFTGNEVFARILAESE